MGPLRARATGNPAKFPEVLGLLAAGAALAVLAAMPNCSCIMRCLQLPQGPSIGFSGC